MDRKVFDHIHIYVSERKFQQECGWIFPTNTSGTVTLCAAISSYFEETCIEAWNNIMDIFDFYFVKWRKSNRIILEAGIRLISIF